MNSLRTVQLDSLAAFRAGADAWDDLWRRSEVTLPTLRVEPAAQWIEHFAPGAAFRAVIVECGGRAVAGLPLVGSNLAGVLRVARLPGNEWSATGDLLLDPAAATPAVGEALVAALGDVPWPLLWLEDVTVDAPRWRFLAEAFAREQVRTHYHELLRIGRIDARGDWDACRSTWSRKHRQGMAAQARRLARLGEIDLERVARLAPGEVEPQLRDGFAIEDRGWKGAAGTSVLRSPGIFDFYLRQARQLAAWGQLELVFLRSAGRPIAFAYGLAGKGAFHSIKVGYDPEYARFSPGQLLRYFLFERLFHDPGVEFIDYMPPTDAHRKWRPKTYGVGRLVVASQRWLGRAALAGYVAMRRYRGKP